MARYGVAFGPVWLFGATRSAGITMPRLISSMISAGSSERGLSEVTMTRSLKRAATAPMSDRLGRSRSPPHPKTVITRPSGQRTRGLEEVSQRIVGVRVVHDDAYVILRFGNELEAAWHERERRDALLDGIEREVERHGGGHGREDVVSVGAADERRPKGQRPSWGAHLESKAVEGEGQRPGPDVCGRVDRIGDRPRSAGSE